MLIHTHNYQNEYTILQNIRDLILQKIYKYSIHSLKKNNIIIYQLEDGKTKIDVKLEDKTNNKCLIYMIQVNIILVRI